MRTLVIILIILLLCVLLFGCDHPAAQAPQSDSTPKMTILPRVSAANTAARPLEGLSSDNPNERLQIVRQAQDKWGTEKHSQSGDRHDIVGRWNNQWSDSVYLLLNADGTFKNVAVFGQNEGTYRLLPNDQIEFTSRGFFGPNVVVLEYRLLGDTLEYKLIGQWVPRKRASQ